MAVFVQLGRRVLRGGVSPVLLLRDMPVSVDQRSSLGYSAHRGFIALVEVLLHCHVVPSQAPTAPLELLREVVYSVQQAPIVPVVLRRLSRVLCPPDTTVPVVQRMLQGVSVKLVISVPLVVRHQLSHVIVQ